jgi:dienelactone hydrolase
LVDPASHASRAVLAQAVEDCVSYARSRGAGPGEKVVALGFGAGGYTAFLAACWSRIQLAVVVYADAIAPILTSIDAELGAWKRSVAPVHLVFGSTDPAAGARQVGDLQARLSFYRVAHDIVVYPRVGADFMDETSAAYRDAAADDAHRRLVGWISSAKHSRRQRRAFRGR